MKGEWKVTRNIMMGDAPYGVFRLINVNAVNHSGNREYIEKYFATSAEAEEVAKRMNEMELSIDAEL